MYSIMSSTDGSVVVTARNATDFPSEKDEDSKVKTVVETPLKRKLSLRGSVQESSTSRNLDDGSVIDVLCMYTREAVCQQAISLQLVTTYQCNVTKYKYLMDSKCQVAVAQSVRFDFHTAVSLHCRK